MSTPRMAGASKPKPDPDAAAAVVVLFIMLVAIGAVCFTAYKIAALFADGCTT